MEDEEQVDEQSRCGWLSLGEGRICDEPAVGVYIGLGGKQPVCVKHRDWLRREWGIDVRPLPEPECCP